MKRVEVTGEFLPFSVQPAKPPDRIELSSLDYETSVVPLDHGGMRQPYRLSNRLFTGG